MQPRIMAMAVAVTLVSASVADADTCLPSPAAVRKLQPNAWPQWTRQNGKRCWFAGKKPVATKAAPRRPKAARQPAPKAERDWDFQSGDPIWQQPWSMEYRWDAMRE
jgi:hypothetical protein